MIAPWTCLPVGYWDLGGHYLGSWVAVKDKQWPQSLLTNTKTRKCCDGPQMQPKGPLLSHLAAMRAHILRVTHTILLQNLVVRKSPSLLASFHALVDWKKAPNFRSVTRKWRCWIYQVTYACKHQMQKAIQLSACCFGTNLEQTWTSFLNWSTFPPFCFLMILFVPHNQQFNPASIKLLESLDFQALGFTVLPHDYLRGAPLNLGNKDMLRS